ncbi:PucR family transcriptional regulator [Herbidospora sp. NEAU-GS84]|uniref:PucR family transcriptional regulator n=2 Tax=Herbidospora solisilvae TaxID=2696284 RepID=A0A7C9J1G7_9ACTN|nr:PucR family transcriptional regulator [Herbidospora solisilvae]
MHNNVLMQDLVDEIARLLDASVTVEDRAFELVAYGVQSGVVDEVRQESILRRRATAATRAHFEAYGIAAADHPVRIPEAPGFLARVCVPLRHKGVTYGYLWLLDSGKLPDSLLDRAEPLFARLAAALAHEAQIRRAPLDDLFSPNPQARAEAARGIEGPLVALAVAAGPAEVPVSWSLPRDVLTGQAGAHPAFLAPPVRAREAATRLNAMYGVPVGAGDPRQDPEDAWESWREALNALRVAEKTGEAVAHWSELGVYRYLVRLPHHELAELAGESAALPEELATTLETYLDRAAHVQQTAAALGIHRQTLYYRLGRAAEFTGKNLSDGQDRLLLHLSLKARRL